MNQHQKCEVCCSSSSALCWECSRDIGRTQPGKESHGALGAMPALPPQSCCTSSPSRFSNNIMGWLAIGKMLDSRKQTVTSGGRGCKTYPNFPLPHIYKFPLGISHQDLNIIPTCIWTQIFVRHNKERLKSTLTCVPRQAA